MQKYELSLSMMFAGIGGWSNVGALCDNLPRLAPVLTMLRNAGTADSYTYSVDGHVVVLPVLSAVQVGLLIMLGRIKNTAGFSRKRVAFRWGMLVANCLALYIVLFDGTPAKPLKSIG